MFVLWVIKTKFGFIKKTVSKRVVASTARELADRGFEPIVYRIELPVEEIERLATFRKKVG